MQEPVAIVAEHLAQTQELAKSHYLQSLNAAIKQQQIISGLRKENDDLRARLRAMEGQRTLKSTGMSRKSDDLHAQSHVEENDWAIETASLASLSLERQPTEARPLGWVSPEPTTSVSTPQRRFSGEAHQLQAGLPIPMGTPSVLSKEKRTRLSSPSTSSRSSTVPDVPLPSHGPSRLRRFSEFFVSAPKRNNASPAMASGAEAMKARVQETIFKPEYHTSDYYKQKGVAQKVARSVLFDNITVAVIFLNAIWIAIDSDLNEAPVIFQADLIFQVAEYFFYAYFFFELTVRFVAFESKRDCLRDPWFLFDAGLMFLMTFDSWLMQVIILKTGTDEASNMSAVPVLRILRLLRLTRMMRMYRLLQKAPELMILIKGITGAMRSVGFALVLLSGVIYIFAIVFRTLTHGTEIGTRYFSTVPRAASTLLFDGTLPDLAGIVYNVSDEHIMYGIILTIFILIASLTVMNLLVGVLVEVVSTVSLVEKAHMEARFLRGHMLQLLPCLDSDGDLMISKEEFGQLMLKPKAIAALQEVGVDVVGLAELSDFIYKDVDELSFRDFMETVLELRSTNTATVRSIVDTRKFITTELARIEENLIVKMQQIINVDFKASLARTLQEGQLGGRAESGDLRVGGGSVHSLRGAAVPVLPLCNSSEGVLSRLPNVPTGIQRCPLASLDSSQIAHSPLERLPVLGCGMPNTKPVE